MRTFFSATLGWLTAGWQQLVLGLAVVAIASAAAYIRGHSDGENAILAGQTKAYAAALKDFQGKTDEVLAKATHDAFADFDARMKALGDVAKTLKALGAIQDANSQTLASALRGRFVLSPAERLRFECVRRPADIRCTAPADPSVRAAVP